jgi:membrane associated rhomboid family serine protease
MLPNRAGEFFTPRIENAATSTFAYVEVKARGTTRRSLIISSEFIEAIAILVVAVGMFFQRIPPPIGYSTIAAIMGFGVGTAYGRRQPRKKK